MHRGRGRKSSRGKGKSRRSIVAKTPELRRLRALSRSAITGKFSRMLEQLVEETDPLDDELIEVEAKEKDDEWEELDPDWELHREDDDSTPEQDYEYYQPSDAEIIEGIVQRRLETAEIELDYEDIVLRVYNYLFGEEEEQESVLQGLDREVMDFVLRCVSDFERVPKERSAPFDDWYIEVTYDENKNELNAEVVGEIDDRVELLKDEYDYKHWWSDEGYFWSDDVVTGKSLKKNYRDFSENLQFIAIRLIELQPDFFREKDFKRARLALLKNTTAGWQFLSEEAERLSSEVKEERGTLMSLGYADIRVICRHGHLPLRNFYINSRAPWYRLYLPAIFIEEVLVLSPSFKKKGVSYGGVYTSTQFSKRIEAMSGEEFNIGRNAFSYELTDFKRHRGEESVSKIFMGAYPECRKKMLAYIWKDCLQNGEIPTISGLKKNYEPALRKGRRSTKHPEDRPELFEPENQIYFIVAVYTIEMIEHLFQQEKITENLLIRELQEILRDLLYTEGIMNICPDYGLDKHQEWIQQMVKNLTDVKA